MAATDKVKKLDPTKRVNLGITMRGKLNTYIKDRKSLETQMLINLRQYRGEYDQNVLSRIPKDKSRAYPRDTRTKIKGFVAKMMEMMFPATDSNWELSVSPKPSISKDDLQVVIDVLEQREQMAAEAEEREPQNLSSDAIEEAVMEYAEERRDAMQKKIRDQLMDPGVDWPSIAKRTVRSGAIYGWGVAKSPLVRTQKERVFELNKDTAKYEAKVKSERRPYPEYANVWNIYPDLSAPTWEEQEGVWERHILQRNSLRKLGDRDGFDKKIINKYLRENLTGNYKKQPFEASLKKLNTSDTSIADNDGRKYEAYRWVGFLSAQDLIDIGVEDVPGARNEDVFSDLWLVDDIVIYADLAPFGDKASDIFHGYFYTEDESAGLTGLGMPEELRDRQMSICAATRALYDNMAATAGPILEVAVDVLKPGTDYKAIRAFQVIEREGDGQELQHKAVHSINVESHVPEIQAILQDERGQFDLESNLPSWMLGNAQPLGEAFRTSSNMSQMTGGGNMVTKDHVRAFDKFTTGIVGSMLAWNMEYGDDKNKGDFQVRAVGNISLVAKEVRGAALDQFMQTLTPSERQMIKPLDVLRERLKARDLPVELLVTKDEAAQIEAAAQEAAAKTAEAEEGLTSAKTGKLQAEADKINKTIQATIAEIMARIETAKSAANYQTRRAQLETVEKMLAQVVQATELRGQNNGQVTETTP